MKILLMFAYLAITAISFNTAKAQTDGIKIIRSINVEKDYTLDGVIGLNVTYKYNFLPLQEQSHNDSILKGAKFKITTRFFVENEAINPAYGYQGFANIKNELVFTTTLKSQDIKASKFTKSIQVFIPYASLKMPGGVLYKMVVPSGVVKGELSGTDGSGKTYSQKIEKVGINFYKPNTQIVSVTIDSIAVNFWDKRGRAWDFSFGGSDAPDVSVDLNLAGTTLWQKHFNNTYLFSLPNDANTITFTISENDRISLLVEDRDLLVSDLIADIKLKTKGLKVGEWYYYNEAGKNLRGCSIRFRIN